MKEPLALKCGDTLVPYHMVHTIGLGCLESHVEISIYTAAGEEYVAKGTEAIEILMAIKPSALEGRRLRWMRNAWMVHNLIGHPTMQVLAWFRFYKLAIRVHDATVPKPRMVHSDRDR